MKGIGKAARIILVALGLVIVATACQVLLWDVHYCAVCGVQKFDRTLFWFDGLSEPAYDEFGIEKRWVCAHDRVCEHIWVDGGLAGPSTERSQSNDSCWPRLHFLAASPLTVKRRLSEAIEGAGEAEVSRRDCVGRTILHWIAIHPDRDLRDTLWMTVVGKGVDPHARDGDGLTAQQWRSRFDGRATPAPGRCTVLEELMVTRG